MLYYTVSCCVMSYAAPSRRWPPLRVRGRIRAHPEYCNNNNNNNTNDIINNNIIIIIIDDNIIHGNSNTNNNNYYYCIIVLVCSLSLVSLLS